MAEGARVGSVEAIKAFRLALWKFAETVQAALGDAESELNRTVIWLETEQLSHWQHQIRKRQEVLARAKDALRQKQLFKDSAGRTPQAVEEEKAVRRAQSRLADAEQKLANTRAWGRRMQKEAQNYKGGVQRLATSAQVDVPAAVALLDKLVGSLESYVALDAPLPDLEPTSLTGEQAGMGRGEGEEIKAKPQAPMTDDESNAEKK